MSTTIDQRVVEMRFDNKQFESNVSTSMSTIDKLKQSLNFSGTAKGLDNVNSAVKNVNMSGLGSAVETVQAKFSALQVVAVTALANITNSAVNTGKRMVSALTIDPIKTGLQEYETQINSVQTILANTQSKGSTLDDVNRALEELNVYADKTIYNFTEMTRNIGTFTAAGVDLETSVGAIQGIANLAAVSGSTSQQASTAMYQLSQALATGTVKLMDWNSVVNAGMGGEVFQNALKETSKLLGTGAEAAIEAEGSFRDSLSTGWLTAEVLTETLKKFTTTGANEYISEYTGLSVDAVEAALKTAEAQYGEADAVNYAAKALAEKSGKNEDEIKKALQMAKTAEDAATKVKTFSQLWDVMKESAQSGWTQTWKIIIGDFEEAKNLLTPISDFFTGDNGIITAISEARNKLLEGALGKGFSNLVEKINGVLEPAQKVVDSIDKVKGTVQSLDKVVDGVLGGKYGNSDTGRFEKLAKEGYNYCEVQNKVNEALGNTHRYTQEQIDAQNKLLGTQKKTSESTSKETKETIKLTDEKKNLIKKLARMTEEQARSEGYTDEQIAAFRELGETADKLGIPLDEFIDNLDQINGRWLLINSFKNIGQGLVTVIKSIAGAWRDVFPAMQAEQLFDIIASFHKFTTYLTLNDDAAKDLQKTFKGLFAALDIILTIVGGPVKWAFEGLKTILGMFDMDILDLTAAMGEAVLEFRDWIDENNIFVKGFEKVAPAVRDAVKAIKGWIEAFKGSSFYSAASDIIAGLVNGLQDGAQKAWDAIVKMALGLKDKFCEALGIESPSTVFFALGGFIIAGLVAGLMAAGPEAWEAIKGIAERAAETFSEIDFETLFAGGISVGLIAILSKLAGAFSALTGPLELLGDLDNVLDSFTKVMKSFALSLKARAIKDIAISLLIVAGSLVVLTLIEPAKLWNAVAVVTALAAILVGLAFAIDKLTGSAASIGKNGVNIKGLGTSLVSIGLAILLLGATVKLIGSLDPEQAKQGFIGLTALVAEMAIFLLAYGKLVKGKSAQNMDKAGKMLRKMAITLLLMVGVLKLISMMSWGDLGKGAAGMGGLIVFMGLLVLISKIAGKHTDKVGSMMLKLSMAMLLLVGVIKLISMMSWEELKKGAAGMAGFVVFVGLLVLVTKIAGKEVAKIGGLLLSMSISMLLLVGIVKLIASMDWEDLGKGAAGIAVLALVMAGLIYAVKMVGPEAPKIALTLLAMSVAIGIMAAIAIVCSLISMEGLAKGLLAVGVLGSIMALMIMATKGAADCKGSIMAMAIAIGVMAVAVAALSMIDATKLAGAVTALTVLMGMFALIAVSAGQLKGAMGSLIVMTIAVGIMGGVIYLLAQLPVESVFGVAASLSVLLLSLAATLGILSLIGPVATGALAGIGMLAVLIAAIAGILALLGSLSEDAKTTLESGLPVLETIGTAIGSFVGSIVGGFAKGVASTLPEIGSFLTEFMTNAKGFIDGVKTIDESVVAGAGYLAAAILLITAADLIAGVASFIQGGSSFAQLGADLSAFMMNAMGFIMGISIIDPAAMTGVKSLAEAILILTAADVINGLTSWLTGGASLSQFGAQLPQLGSDIATFATNLGSFDESKVNTITCAANAIKSLAAAAETLPNEGGWLAKIVGDNSIATFGAYLPQLGTNLSSFATNLGTFSEEQVNTVTCAANAVKAIAKAAEEIPNQGGWLAKIVGDNSIATFGSHLPLLGTSLAGFATNLGTFTDEQVSTVGCAANAVKAIAQAAEGIPNEGGWLAKIVGDNSIETFGGYLPGLGTNLAGFAKNLGTFSETQVITVRSAVNALKAFAGLADTDLSGLNAELGPFGRKIVTLAEKLAEFCTEMDYVDSTSIDTAVSNVKDLVGMIKDMSVIDTEAADRFSDAMEDIADNSIDDFLDAFASSSTLSDVESAAEDLLDALVDGIENGAPDVKDAFTDAASDAANAINTTSYYKKFYNAGSYMVDGFCAGISENMYKAKAKARAMANAAEQAAEEALGIASPSKVFYSIGDFAGIGFVNALADYRRKAYNAGAAVANFARNGLSEAIGRVADFITSDVDVQPTIRPVLDLSEVSAGAGAISNMLNTSPSVGVMSNVRAINSMMNNQNGVNDDVVSAINRLRKDLGNVGNTNYNVNGITYDDGSNVAAAVKAIVRAVKMERRV